MRWLSGRDFRLVFEICKLKMCSFEFDIKTVTVCDLKLVLIKIFAFFKSLTKTRRKNQVHLYKH